MSRTDPMKVVIADVPRDIIDQTHSLRNTYYFAVKEAQKPGLEDQLRAREQQAVEACAAALLAKVVALCGGDEAVAQKHMAEFKRVAETRAANHWEEYRSGDSIGFDR